ncbi:uncharacterized protein LOC136077647 [Hydra vulgaris]|uniref:Uncharacterized protein LOC136077647 n=1 Tax=Hydra vulgaris TaxID=6087 RepID=A0ABM4BG50_HYDVU
MKIKLTHSRKEECMICNYTTAADSNNKEKKVKENCDKTVGRRTHEKKTCYFFLILKVMIVKYSRRYLENKMKHHFDVSAVNIFDDGFEDEEDNEFVPMSKSSILKNMQILKRRIINS